MEETNEVDEVLVMDARSELEAGKQMGSDFRRI